MITPTVVNRRFQDDVDALSLTRRKPSERLYPKGMEPFKADRKDAAGNITTDRASAAQKQAIADFDRNVLPGLSGDRAPTEGDVAAGRAARPNIVRGPSAETIQANRAARLKKDPYDLDYNSNYSGSTMGADGSGRAVAPAPTVGPKTRTDGLAVAPAPTQQAPGLAMKFGAAAMAGQPAQTDALAGALPRPATPNPAFADINREAPRPMSQVPMAMRPAGPPEPVGSIPEPPGGHLATTPMAMRGPGVAADINRMPTRTADAEIPPTSPNLPTNPSPAMGEVAGRSLASGVSNSQAAQFTQPTKDKLVQTPTSPVLDANDLDRKNTKPFAGF